MEPFEDTWYIAQGTDWELTYTFYNDDWTKFNFTGYSARAQIREAYADEGGGLIADMTTANGGISLGGVNGTLTLGLPAALTEDLNLDKDDAIFDIEWVAPDGKVTRCAMGTVKQLREVTR